MMGEPSDSGGFFCRVTQKGGFRVGILIMYDVLLY